ncbi:hypothetical protein LJC47_03725 [Desulfosarcina sp. OttesenSCG-928-B08]|nr:hypothetical protein [Desulfosarcina sp. OttesenSCG-928-B08]
MLNQPSWFSATYYYQEKMKEMVAGGSTMTLGELQAAIAEVGGAWTHYEVYGYKESYTSSTTNVETYFSLQDSNGKVVFDPQAYCESKLEQLLSIGHARVDATSTWQDVAQIIIDADMSLYDHYVMFGQAEGLSINSTFSTQSFFAAKATYIQANVAQYPGLAHLDTWQKVASFYAANQIDAYQNWVQYGAIEGITADDVKPGSDPVDPGTGKNFYLNPIGWYGNIADGTLGHYYADDIEGTAGNDKFFAYVYGDQNSLNTGDHIDGKGGVDRLFADIAGTSVGDNGNGIGYISALTPQIEHVEILKFRVQETGTQTGDNNVGGRIDAERIEASAVIRDTPMAGKTGAYTEFWSWNSRDDLLIEDVRIDSTSVVVGMQNTDPGAVDYGFYFDSLHLVHEGAGYANSTFSVRIMDMDGARSGSPFLENPFYAVRFHFNDRYYDVNFGKFEGADLGYDDLVAAIEAALQKMMEDDPTLPEVTVEIGTEFTWNHPEDNMPLVGKAVVFKGANGVFDVSNANPNEPDNWRQDDQAGLNNATIARYGEALTVGCPLIQTNIALDNVGRVQWADASPFCLPDDSIYGSNAGDMIVGSMATRGGIERFDVYVDRGSWLNGLFSTNNTLRMITVTAADWDEDGYANSKDAVGQGQLFIGAHGTAVEDMDDLSSVGGTDQTFAGNMVNWQDVARVLARFDGGGNRAGIVDVKYFEASDYAGDISIAAEFTAEARAKYLEDVDGLRTVYSLYAPGGAAPGGDFVYNFGSGNDTLNMRVNGGIAADRDFILRMNMGDGDDYLNFSFNFQTGNQAISQTGLQNVFINTGAGNDTVWAWGQAMAGMRTWDQVQALYDGVAGYVNVDAGAGADAVYTAQGPTANNAVWVINANTLAWNPAEVWNPSNSNTSDEDPLGVFINAVGQAQPISNNIASTTDTYGISTNRTGIHTLTVVVEFLGVSAEAKVSETYNVSAGETRYNVKFDLINKAIIAAIEDDPRLSKLVAAFDGAGESLLLQSLVDGVYTTQDISIRFYDTVGGIDRAYWTPDPANGYDFIEQAHLDNGNLAGIANRTFTIDFIGGDYDAADVGTTYTITIDGVNITYTQALDGTDSAWTDIIEGLQGALAGTSLNGRYTLATEIDAAGDAVNDGSVIITRVNTDYIGNATGDEYDRSNDPDISFSMGDFLGQTATLTFTTTPDWGANPTAGTEYVLRIEVGGVLRTITGTGANWTDVLTSLNAAADAVVTAWGAALVPDDITITRSTAGVITVEINNLNISTGYPDVDVDSSTQSFVIGADSVGTQSATITFAPTVAADTYTITIDGHTITYTEAAAGEAWGVTFAGLDAALLAYQAANPTAIVGYALSDNSGAIPNSLIVSSNGVPPQSITATQDTGAVTVDPTYTASTATYVIDLTGWEFTAEAAGTIYSFDITIAGTTETITVTQLIGEDWTTLVGRMNTALTGGTVTVPAGMDDGQVRISVPNRPVGAPNVTIDITYVAEETRIDTITVDNYSDYAATNRSINVFGWDYVSGATDTYTITIDGVTLTYTQGEDSLGNPDTWATIVDNLQSLIPGTALEGVIALTAAGDGVLTITRIAAGAVGDIDNYAGDPVVTITYPDGTSWTNVTGVSGFDNYVSTVYREQDLVGEDHHYYGLSEVFGGDGDDVLVTGYADAWVEGGAGNDVIVVGNNTYNIIDSGLGSATGPQRDTIWLGARSATDAAGNVLYQGNNGNNMGLAEADPANPNLEVNPTAHDKVFVNVGEGGDVIYNFDVGGTFTFDWFGTRVDDTNASPNVVTAAIQSDRLYGVSGSSWDLGTYDAATGNFSIGGTGGDMQLDGGTVVLIGVGNVAGTIGLGSGTDEFGTYITVNAA